MSLFEACQQVDVERIQSLIEQQVGMTNRIFHQCDFSHGGFSVI